MKHIIAADATATMSKNARGATISFRFRHCESLRSFALVVTSMLTCILVDQLNGCASSTSKAYGCRAYSMR